jgi:glutamyl-Q tRNA(Asp) synthetase
VAALGSYLDARSQGGEWLVRIEDIDTPRVRPGATEDILRTLEAFGFEWVGPVLLQSNRADLYLDVVNTLVERGVAYPCSCSRREVAAASTAGVDGPVYPGTCRLGAGERNPARSVRLRTEPATIEVEDRIQGRVRQQIERDVGDFIVHRADGISAYQLAVVLDDAAEGVTDVVRGADLLHSTPRQVYLQRVLGLSTPRYAHLPVAVDGEGRKLSKSESSTPVDPAHPLPALLKALAFIGQPEPEPTVDLRSFWTWAIQNWDPLQVPRRATRPVAEVLGPPPRRIT